jgi:hypothetical protein
MHNEPPVDVDLLKQMGYQKEDLDIKPLMVALVGLGIFTVFAAVVSWLFFVLFLPKDAVPDNKPARTAARRVPPMAKLQADPMKEISDFRAEEKSVLDHAGWIDKEKGIARIPVHQALEKVASEGLPVRGEAVPDAPAAETPETVQPKPVPSGVIPEHSPTDGAESLNPSLPRGTAMPGGAH